MDVSDRILANRQVFPELIQQTNAAKDSWQSHNEIKETKKATKFLEKSYKTLLSFGEYK